MGDKRVLISGNGLGKSIFASQEEALRKAYEKGKADGIKEANADHNVECGDHVRQLTAADEARIRVNERKKVLDEVIKIAREEIDFENQAEQIRFVEFMEEMKEE